jgi:2-amino-4-hydroxy-6-hydroxymethyldihydropteridine diphosphokinase
VRHPGSVSIRENAPRSGCEDILDNIREALRLLAKSASIVSISTFYREPAIDRREEPDFYNGVVAIDTDLPPITLKWNVLRAIEAALGRRRSADKYESRTSDLGLLIHGDSVLSSNELTLPDPDILERAFIAVPLSEIAPELVLPGFGVPIRQVAEQFGDRKSAAVAGIHTAVAEGVALKPEHFLICARLLTRWHCAVPEAAWAPPCESIRGQRRLFPTRCTSSRHERGLRCGSR